MQSGKFQAAEAKPAAWSGELEEERGCGLRTGKASSQAAGPVSPPRDCHPQSRVPSSNKAVLTFLSSCYLMYFPPVALGDLMSFFFFFLAAPPAHGSSQTRDRTRATAGSAIWCC